MDLREQKYVCTLAELGNLTRAAERLYISQPALSIYITNLEKNLGIPLFDRSGKKFTLTYAGEQYVEKAKKMLELEREFCEDIEKITRAKPPPSALFRYPNGCRCKTRFALPHLVLLVSKRRSRHTPFGC